jgi:hypothetical protein
MALLSDERIREEMVNILILYGRDWVGWPKLIADTGMTDQQVVQLNHRQLLEFRGVALRVTDIGVAYVQEVEHGKAST